MNKLYFSDNKHQHNYLLIIEAVQNLNQITMELIETGLNSHKIETKDNNLDIVSKLNAITLNLLEAEL